MRVAVVGLGAFGTMAAWRLAVAGADVVGYEAHTIGHDRGSSHGTTRLFRVLCLEHEGLVAVAMQSRSLIRELEAATGAKLLTTTGGITVGPEDSELVRTTLDVARATGVDHTLIAGAALRHALPQRRDNGSNRSLGVIDPAAGIIRAEETVFAAATAAKALGADLREGAAASVEDTNDGVVVTADGKPERFDHVVVTVGAWLARFAPELPLTPIRTLLHWFDARPGEEKSFSTDRFGVVLLSVDGHVLWGHGRGSDHRMKFGVGSDPAFREIDPDALATSQPAGDGALVSELVRASLPGVGPSPASTHPCMYTQTPDGQFVVGRLRSRVSIAGGCNGHGFKHAAAIGQALAEDALGLTPTVRLPFADPLRFADTVAAHTERANS